MKIEKDDFNQWLDHPVTEWVFARLRDKSEECKQSWLARSWGQGQNDPLLLADLRARAEAWTDIADMKYEDIADGGNEAKT